MAIDLAKLMALRIETPHTYDRKDVMLYALGLGVGADPMSPKQLSFVYERNLKVLPTFGGVMGYPGFWPRDRAELGLNWKMLLNGEQGIRIHKPLPTAGSVVGAMAIDRVIDKGPGKGMVMHLHRDVTDAKTGELLLTVENTAMFRGDGGFGGPTEKSAPPRSLPDRAPDLTFDWPVLPQAALIYRLSGDYNPVHSDPEIAKEGGFDRPILHGAASWGIAGYALLDALCEGEPSRFKYFHARFTSPAYPGETQRTQIWKTGKGEAAFRVVSAERGKTILDFGTFSYTP